MPRYDPHVPRGPMHRTDGDVCKILEHAAPSKRSYGHVLSRLLRDLKKADAERQLCQRLETCLSTLEGIVGQHV